MKLRNSKVIHCEIFKNPCKLWLENTWLSLEQRAQSGLFLSWFWIGTWLDHFVNEFFVIEAKRDSKIVGLGIFIIQSSSIFFIPLKNKFHLHRTGIANQDQIWMEYNDFLLDAHDENDIRLAMIEFLSYQLKKRDAIVIGASDNQRFSAFKQLGFRKRTFWQTKNYELDLNVLRENDISLNEFLSRNSRYQISRSLKKYSQIGEVVVEKANSIDKANEMLQIAKPLHLARWKNKHSPSGFSNKHFVDFHQVLIEKGLNSGLVELYHIKAGNQTISILYNFKYKNRIYFYLCAINYSQESKHLKPGLVSHYLLINQALKEGVDSYDFMGGKSRYKETFSNIKGNLSICQYEQPTTSLKLENLFRNTKRWLIKKQNNALNIINRESTDNG